MAIAVPTVLSRVLSSVRFPVRYPTAAVEIDPSGVSAVQVRRARRGGRLVAYGLARIANGAALGEPALGEDLEPVEPVGSEAEPDGSSFAGEDPVAPGDEPGDPATDSPSPLAAPEPAPARPAPYAQASAARGEAVEPQVREAIGTALRMAGLGAGRASLVVPDSAARVWILQLPELPRGSQAMLDMIRWKVKRGLPFRVEDGVISWQILARASGGEPATLLAGLIPRGFIKRHEAVLAEHGLRIGLVDVASLNLANLAVRTLAVDEGDAPRDFGLLNATPGYFTLLLFRQGSLVFYRCKAHPVGETDPAERERTLRRELAASLSYYTERLRGGALGLTLVRATDPSLADPLGLVESLGFGRARAIDAGRAARLPEGMNERIAVQLQPALGAALGRHG